MKKLHLQINTLIYTLHPTFRRAWFGNIYSYARPGLGSWDPLFTPRFVGVFDILKIARLFRILEHLDIIRRQCLHSQFILTLRPGLDDVDDFTRECPDAGMSGPGGRNIAHRLARRPRTRSDRRTMHNRQRQRHRPDSDAILALQQEPGSSLKWAHTARVRGTPREGHHRNRLSL